MDNYINMPPQTNVSVVAPQTTIILCKGVPWDNTYTHVRKFVSRETLVEYLKTKAVRTITESAPVKAGNMTVRLPYNELVAMDCNYLMFQNLPYDSRWHFAFITGISALSVNSSIVNFEYDVWQETIFDVDFKPCFIDRSHVAKADDIIGKYTMPEGLELGDYITNSTEYQFPETNAKTFSVVIATNSDTSGEPVSGSVINHVYQGTRYYTFADSGKEGANDFINTMVGANLMDSIVDCFMIPTEFAGINESTNYKSINIPKKYDNINGYVPKNNKLFCYPYNVLYATNNLGSSTEYKYELFSDSDNATFEGTIAMSCNPTGIIYPTNYKGIGKLYQESMNISGFPHCSLAIDSFKAYIAQSGGSQLVEKLQSVFHTSDGQLNQTGNLVQNVINNLGLEGFVGGIGGAYAKTKGITESQMTDIVNAGATALSGITGGLTGVLNSIGSMLQAYIAPPTSKGADNPTIARSIDCDNISFYRMQIKPEYAKNIDDFFSMFGYKIGHIDIPNIDSRSAWNYIKTVDCAFTGNVELSMLSQLRAIFNKGVTVWHTNDIGNYNLDNN